MAFVFWDRKEVLMVGFMQQGTTMACIAKHTKNKNCIWPFRTRGMEC
jgi:hypothetical protein